MYDILERINQPSDLKTLDKKELSELCKEIRSFLVDKVTKNGGHLASNLGVVELTVALHLVFDMPRDKVVWDVGHQTYVHKILTGRRDAFDTLRTYKGLSGFPKTSESIYDCFNTGHSSTSVSAALGIARARDLKGEDSFVAAVFGDGAMTGGMIYEAINDVGHNKTPLILILNDNEMSISQNVGALSKYLRRLRHTKTYHRSKAHISSFLSHIPLMGGFLQARIRGMKDLIKSRVLPSTFFGDLGVEYLGPVDGHNLFGLVNVLNIAKSMNEPVLIHVKTKKGKGYEPAEKNPHIFHGISPQGGSSKTELKYSDYSQCAGETLIELAQKNHDFVAISAAMPLGVGLGTFSHKYSDRFFDVGIAEQHAVTFCAGLAISGITPVFAVYSSFLQRSYDQILHDVCLQNLHVVFLVDRAGVVGADGETHHGLYDIAFLSDMPYMTILSPSCYEELEQMLEYAINEHDGPIAIRYPRGSTQATESEGFELNKIKVINPEGRKVIITHGRMAHTAISVAELMENIKIVVLPTIYPVPDELWDELEGAELTVVLDDHSISGGLGMIISSAASARDIQIHTIAFPSTPVIHGTVSQIDKHYGLDAQSVAQKIKELADET